MYVITHKSKPATLRRLYLISQRKLPYGYDDAAVNGYAAAPREDLAIEIFLRHIGGSWDERAKGIGVRYYEFPCMATGERAAGVCDDSPRRSRA